MAEQFVVDAHALIWFLESESQARVRSTAGVG